MSFERPSGIPVEPVPPASAAPSVTEAAGAEPISPQLRLQILSTEHWSLLASRSLAWNKSFSRASMFLTTLSGLIVALGLSAQASGFGSSFLLFALVLLPVVLFVGSRPSCGSADRIITMRNAWSASPARSAGTGRHRLRPRLPGADHVRASVDHQGTGEAYAALPRVSRR